MDKRKLLSYMVGNGFTQRTLAAEMKISPNTLGDKLSGKRPFDTNQINQLCSILGISDDAEKVKIFLSGSSQMRDTA